MHKGKFYVEPSDKFAISSRVSLKYLVYSLHEDFFRNDISLEEFKRAIRFDSFETEDAAYDEGWFYNLKVIDESYTDFSNKITRQHDNRGYWICSKITIESLSPLTFECDGIIYTPYI